MSGKPKSVGNLWLALLTVLWLGLLAAMGLALFAPVAHAQVQGAGTPSVAVGEPDPNANRRIDAVFSAWDRDHDKVLSLDEFRSGWSVMRRDAQVQSGLRQRFVTLDTNRSGAIEPAEYAKIELIKKAGKTAPPLSNFDGNNNSKLEFAEYLALVRTLTRQPAGGGKP